MGQSANTRQPPAAPAAVSPTTSKILSLTDTFDVHHSGARYS
ncbi:hypothetical protein I546_3360 [Mycobacterium kansasii 732]|nr:hypothetical protein I546_3360 [Mycobacterium kansasii 732]